MAPITKLIGKTKTFLWTKEFHKAWELIKQKYIDITKLASGISCSYRCIIISYKGYTISEFDREE